MNYFASATTRIRPRRKSHGAFTLIELLVVISIIALLIGLLLPALAAARGVARQTKCLSNLKQMGVAMGAYQGEFKDQFPLRAIDQPSGWDWGWDSALYTFLKSQGDTTAGNRLVEDADSGIVEIYQCPSATTPRSFAFGSSNSAAQDYGMLTQTNLNNFAFGVKLEITDLTTGRLEFDDDSDGTPWVRTGYNLIDTTGTAVLSEIDAEGRVQGQGGRRFVTPERQMTTDGSDSSLRDNFTSDLHGDSKVNFLFADSHASIDRYDSEAIIGENGTITKPQGAWTITPGD